MEPITKNDIRYLIALTASEESMLVEIIWEFNKWDCDKALVLKELFRLVSDNHVSIFRQNSEEVTDLSREQSLTLVREWSSLNLKDHFFVSHR